MRHVLIFLVGLTLLAGSAFAQAPPVKDPLLERLTGTWVLRGTLAGKQTAHDVAAEWVLGHLYLRLHEVSREKDAAGQPQYEAIVLIGWDETAREYQCQWLDTTGGGALKAESVGHGKREGDKIPFVWTGEGRHAVVCQHVCLRSRRRLVVLDHGQHPEGQAGAVRPPHAHPQIGRVVR